MLEIRRVNRTNLYKDVDRVLASGHDIATSATELALNHMFRQQHYFSVCTVERVAKMNDICISARNMEIYNTLHCVHWNTMDKKQREYLLAMILKDFEPVLNPDYESATVEVLATT